MGKIRYLSRREKSILFRHLLRLSKDYPSITRFVEDWHSLCLLADKKLTPRKYNPRGKKQVWSLVERSGPVIINGQIWIERVMYHTVENKLYLDIRRWTERIVYEQGQEVTRTYVPTEEGILHSMEDQFKLFELGLKLGLKHQKEK